MNRTSSLLRTVAALLSIATPAFAHQDAIPHAHVAGAPLSILPILGASLVLLFAASIVHFRATRDRRAQRIASRA
jgi:hypothetical protein